MVSAVVVSLAGLPGEGFFDLARSLGYLFDDPVEFYRVELESVFRRYSQVDQIGSNA
jgi:hypothetical protein